jgi:hypothetical protein
MKKIVLATIAIILAFSASLNEANGQFPQFTLIDTGVISTSYGHHMLSGCFDMDNDGDLDLIITNTSGYNNYTNHPNLMYINERNGLFRQVTNTSYTNLALTVGLPGPFGDIDNDDDVDLMYLDWFGPDHQIFLNDGYGNFEIGQLILFAAIETVFMDFNNDSFLDLMLFNGNDSRVCYNDGTGRFSNSVKLNIPCSNPKAIPHCISLGDADDDGEFDLYIGYSILPAASWLQQRNEFFLNQDGVTFKKFSNDSLIVQDTAFTPAVNWIDYDNDGDMDLYVLNSWNPYSPVDSKPGALFENKGNLTFEKHIIEPLEYRDAHRSSSVWGDLDNDGDLDLYITIDKNPFGVHVSPIDHNLLLQNNGDGTFNELKQGPLAEESSTTAAIEDFDNDGDLDVLLVRYSFSPDGINNICMNEGNANSWIAISCEGTLSNHSAYGTRVIAKANVNGKPTMQTREITPITGHATYPSSRVHFGLGNANVVDTLLIRWPSGHIDTYLNVKASQFYRAIEDSVLVINFAATSYIKCNATIPNLTLLSGEIKTIHMQDYCRFMAGDTLPEITGDTLTWSVHENENPALVNATFNENDLILTAGTDGGTSNISFIASAGFTKRLGSFIVTVEHVNEAGTYLTDDGIKIYPNPAKDYLTVEFEKEFSEPVTYELEDIIGRVVCAETLEAGYVNTHQINITSLPGGTYILRIYNIRFTTKRKIIKVH